jgi:bacterioferritin (cytochrome b1)
MKGNASKIIQNVMNSLTKFTLTASNKMYIHAKIHTYAKIHTRAQKAQYLN